MSEEANIALVRELLGMFRQRDHERVFEFYDPEIEWDASRNAAINPDIAGVYHGHEGVRRYWRNWLEAWSDLDFDVDDVVANGDEVAALIRNQRQWGRHSGIVTEMPPYGIVFTVKDGKVTRWRSYMNQEEALEAAGIAV
jgi:ketosteroid isomerase-like protein